MPMITLWQKGQRLLGLTLAVTLLACASAQAQTEDTGAQARQVELQSLQQTLAMLRAEVMEANPRFEERQAAWQLKFMSRVRDEGIRPRQALRELQDMERELRGDELEDEARAAMEQSYVALRERLIEARRVALADETVNEERDALQEDLIAAMTSRNAEVPEMIDRFEQLRRELANAGNSSRSDQ